MLKINLLTKRFDALREYRKMLAGDPCDYLTMVEDPVVEVKARHVIRTQRIDARIARQMLHRRGMSAVGSEFLGANGQPNLVVGKPTPEGKDKTPSGVVTMRNSTERVKTSLDFKPVPEPTPVGGMFERNAVHRRTT